MNKDSLGNRMKQYEKNYSLRMMNYLPIIARIDGKSFHTWTKKMKCIKPFDNNLMTVMFETMRDLIRQTHAVCGYTQSDEISLVYFQRKLETQIDFSGSLAKWNSILASMTTAIFNRVWDTHLTELAYFDCRVWQVPNQEEVANYLIWRENDAARNSIQMVGQANFSHKQLHRKSCKEIQEMLFQERGINWNNLPVNQKRGSYLIPNNTQAANLFLKKATNRVGIIFNGETPIYDNCKTT